MWNELGKRQIHTEQTHTGLQQPVICHFDLELSEIKTCNAASGLQVGAVISMCSWIGSNCITQFSTEGNLYLLFVLKSAVFFFFC